MKEKESKLIDRKELVSKHPALGRRRHTLNWLIRTRQIPVVPIGRRIYFDEVEIEEWVKRHRISAQNEDSHEK